MALETSPMKKLISQVLRTLVASWVVDGGQAEARQLARWILNHCLLQVRTLLSIWGLKEDFTCKENVFFFFFAIKCV